MSLADGQLFHSQSLQFLPSGKGLIMVAAEPGKAPRTYMLMMDGSAPKAFGPEGFTGTSASPDAKYVLGRKDEAWWLVALAGDQAPQPLPFIHKDEVPSDWSSDSLSVYVSNVSVTPAKVYVVDIKTGKRRLHHEQAPGDLSGVAGTSSGRTTPDGNFYIYGVARTLSYLYVVEGLK
jgi:hypothetical protein